MEDTFKNSNESECKHKNLAVFHFADENNWLCVSVECLDCNKEVHTNKYYHSKDICENYKYINDNKNNISSLIDLTSDDLNLKFNIKEGKIVVKKCICGEILKYEDNSIMSENLNVQGLYYCDICHKIYDGDILDCDNEYLELNKQKYKKYINWFSTEYKNKKLKILKGMINHNER